MAETDANQYEILWDNFEKNKPSIMLKFGVKTKVVKLHRVENGKRRLLDFESDTTPLGNRYVSLTGRWENINPDNPDAGSVLSLKLKNESSSSIRLMRVIFRVENGLDKFLNNVNKKNIAFLSNGFQSWSESRSYKLKDKPLHSWLPMASLMSDNLSNLPTDNYGSFCSELFTMIADVHNDKAILIGQMKNFNQFIYLNAILKKTRKNKRNLEVIFDFGRKLIGKGEEIELDKLFFIKGDLFDIQKQYFKLLKEELSVTPPPLNSKGWCTWYCYSNNLTSGDIYSNLAHLKNHNFKLDYFQIDDGYENKVGDWLILKDSFVGKMKEIAGHILQTGYKPAIWIAPFIADSSSELVRNYPEFVLKTEKGKLVKAGFNPIWSGIVYYSLDITNPLFQEYLQEVIHTYTYDWGFELFKLDFLYAGCDETGFNQNLKLSRNELIKTGIDLIKGAAKPGTVMLGCGMPLASGAGNVEFMRIGIDTAPYWDSIAGYLLGSPGEMIGAKNSLRNTIVRSYMNKKLWVNDPECFMVREKKHFFDTTTLLNHAQVESDINGKLLAGGLVMFSDDITKLDSGEIDKMRQIMELSNLMYTGETIPLDLMENEIPQILYNTAGYLGLFNFSCWKKTMTYNLGKYKMAMPTPHVLQNVWSGVQVDVSKEGTITLEKMPGYSSQLFKIIL